MAKTNPADEAPATLAEAEAARDKAVAEAEKTAEKAVDAIAGAEDKTKGPIAAAIDAAEAADEAQGDVDRATQHVRAGGIAPALEQSVPQFRGVPGDAWGGESDDSAEGRHFQK